MSEALVPCPALYKPGGLVVFTRNPSTGEIEAEGSEIEGHLQHVMGPRPVCFLKEKVCADKYS